VSPGSIYVVSYLAPSGHYSYTSAQFASADVDNAPLHALASTITANGIYSYGSSSAFPTSTYNSTNYWVDPIFSLTS
jgi:hypothetical protein